MLIDLPDIWIATINILGIPACHMGIAWLSTRLPRSLFKSSSPARRKNHHSIYEKLFMIRKWKGFLPDAAPWFDGFPKGSLQSTAVDYLMTFMQETRRGEFSHWMQMAVIACFAIWTPWPYALIILAYSIIANLPCILNLRYTRSRMRALLRKKQHQHHVR